MKISTVAGAALLITLTGCAGSQFGSAAEAGVALPRANGLIEVTAYGSDRQIAMRNATTKAEDICKNNGGYQVVSDEINYRGAISEQNKVAVESAAQIAGILSGRGSVDTRVSTDYEAKLQIRCRQSN